MATPSGSDSAPQSTTVLPGKTPTDEITTARGLDLATPGSIELYLNDAAIKEDAGQVRPLDRITQLRFHAQGGLGEVYLAEDNELHRQVALKQLRHDRPHNAKSRRRFIREAEITAKLEHPGIVPVYGFGLQPDGLPSYVMRFIRGETLHEAIKRFHHQKPLDFGSVSFRQLLRRFIDVCNAVGYAHSRGVLHRDLKPSNVMLGPFGETLILDWGLAKVVGAPAEGDTDGVDERTNKLRMAFDETLTRDDEIVGTVAFMSPEQARGEGAQAGPASDVYSLGVTLYFTLTGHLPFRGNSSAVLDDVCHGKYQQPRAVAPGVPRALEAICVRAMALAPQDRVASPTAFAAEIEHWLADEPVQSYREPWLNRLRRWLRKHRQVTTTAAVLLPLLLVALTVGYVMVRQERDVATRERNEAEAARKLAQANAAASRRLVEDFLIKIGDDKFADVPNFETMRMELVQEAIKRFKELVELQPDDTDLKQDVARAYHRSGNHYRMVNQLKEAEPLYEHALTQLRELRERMPADRDVEGRIAAVLVERSELTYRMHGLQAGEKAYRQAFEETSRLASHPKATRHQRTLCARSHMELGEIMRIRGSLPESIRLQEEAATRYDQLLAEPPTDPHLRMATNFTQINLIRTHREAKDMARSEHFAEKAITLAKDNLLMRPEDQNYRYLMGWAQLETGLLRRDLNQPADVVFGYFNEAEKIFARLVAEAKRVASFQRKLAETLLARGALHLRTNQPKLAEADGEQALALLQSPIASASASKGEEAAACILLARASWALAKQERARECAQLARAANQAARKFAPESPTLRAQQTELTELFKEVGVE